MPNEPDYLGFLRSKQHAKPHQQVQIVAFQTCDLAVSQVLQIKLNVQFSLDE